MSLCVGVTQGSWQLRQSRPQDARPRTGRTREAHGALQPQAAHSECTPFLGCLIL